MLVQSTLSNTIARTRPELPGCVMLAAIPHRRLPGESPVRAVGVAEAVCPNTVTTAGFTLIELSIVLVIIGLIVGGVLVGQNLIASAAVRAQVTQIEKFNTGVNTFYGKFAFLPGDMDPASAAKLNLPVHVIGSAWQTSNNGLIEGCDAQGGNSIYILIGQGACETGQFWADLASQGWLEGNFSGVNAACASDINATNASTCMPAAKIGTNNYISVYTMNNTNWYAIGSVAAVDPNENSLPSGNALSVAQAYNIDKKIDDGLPATGNVIATIYPQWVKPAFPTQAQPTTTSCFDNNNVNNAALNYSLTYPGSAVNCTLSFQIKSGD